MSNRGQYAKDGSKSTYADPAVDASSVTPSDSTVLDCRALYIGGTGDVAVVTEKGTTVTFSNVPVGFFPVACNKVNSTNTTATNIIALF